MTSAQIQLPLAVALKKVLYLTDFSASSEAALPFALAMARKHSGSIEVLHVLTPVIPESCRDVLKADEELADAEMTKIRSQITGILCEMTMAQGEGLWEAIERAIREHGVDLLVAGTHGRTGVPKLVLGSVAEEVFRRSPVPVLTVGPSVRRTAPVQFNRVLLATDFSSESEAAAPYALAFAAEKKSQLTLLHAMPKAEVRAPGGQKAFDASVAEVVNRLYQLLPGNPKLWSPVEVAVEFGEAADCIVEGARQQQADLIVLGVRNAAGHLSGATHLERAIAHKVVIHAPCPVLTVRAHEAAASA
jgi:nucleotide-binding universal stress UspA family protein